MEARLVLAETGLFLVSGFVWITGPEWEDALAWMIPYAPAVLGVSSIYVGGFLIGWFVCRTLKTATIIAGIVLALVGLLAP